MVNKKLQDIICTDCVLNTFGKGCNKFCITDCALIEIEKLSDIIEQQILYIQDLEKQISVAHLYKRCPDE